MLLPEGFDWYPVSGGVDLRRGGAEGRAYAAIRYTETGTFEASVITTAGYAEVRNARCASEEDARALIMRWLDTTLEVGTRADRLDTR